MHWLHHIVVSTDGAFVAKSEIGNSIKKVRSEFVGVGVFSAFVNILALTGSLYMLQVYDRVMPSKSVATLVAFTVLLALLYTAFGLLDYARVRILSRIGVKIDQQLRGRVIQASLLIPLRARSGTNSLQPERDLDQVRTFLSSLGPTAFFDMPWIPVYLGIIYFVHPALGLFALCGAIVLVAITALTEMKTRGPASLATQSGARRASFGDAARRNAEVIHAMGLDQRIAERWQKLTDSFLADQLAISDAASGMGVLSKMLRMLLQSGILGLGAYLSIRGELSSGSIIAGSIVMSRALAPIEIAIANWKGFVGMRQSAKRLNGLLAAHVQNEDKTELPPPVQTLELDAVTVAPPGHSTPAIQNVSFKLEAGDGLGVVGASAAGKSTLMRAIVGAWLPMQQGGTIRLDGAGLDQWSTKDLGRHIGYLPQEISLFDGTVAENIARLDLEAPSDEIIAAAKLAGVHEMIVNLPNGYDTRVGEAGLNLSAGQRQRIGLARAVFGNPFLLVLDEPNSNLDAHGDMALAHAVTAVRARGGIVIVVAHRPAGLAALNKILVLSEGQVQSFGPRDEILRQRSGPMAAPGIAAAPRIPANDAKEATVAVATGA